MRGGHDPIPGRPSDDPELEGVDRLGEAVLVLCVTAIVVAPVVALVAALAGAR